MSLLVKARVLENTRTGPGIFKLVMECGEIATRAQAGQFLNIKVAACVAPLLRRPISIHWVQAEKVEILYQVVGQGTEILAQVQPGDLLDVQGPLGRGFAAGAAGKVILVGGGIGIAPLGLLAKELKGQEVICLLGSRNSATLAGSGGARLQELGLEIKVATDDGSAGIKGLVTELLKHELAEGCSEVRVLACGPKGMLKEVSRLTISAGVECQISLEEHMGCGVGACLGCVCKGVPKFGRENYRRVCTDGPVFDALEVIWE